MGSHLRTAPVKNTKIAFFQYTGTIDHFIHALHTVLFPRKLHGCHHDPIVYNTNMLH